MKIVWLCMFINQEFKDHFNRPDLTNWGVWISHLCELFKDILDIELHVVAPNFYTDQTEKVQRGGITYHFFQHQFNVPQMTQTLATNPLNLNKINEEVGHIVDEIGPDLIHLHGTESPYYTSPALPLNKRYPCVMTVQRFNFMATGESVAHDMVVKFEEMVLRQFKYFGIRTLEMEQIITERNPSAKQFFHNYPVAWPEVLKSRNVDDEDVDVVFFARITRDKGIFDLIEAAELIIKQQPDYKVHLYGHILEKEEPEIKEAVSSAGLESVILFKGNEQDQARLHRIASRARLCVLPTLADIVPGTIIESMLMKLPVVSYAVGGMPQLNEPGNERLKLVSKGDIAGLAMAQLELLSNDTKRQQLSEEAYQFAIEYYSNKKVVRDVRKMYTQVLA